MNKIDRIGETRRNNFGSKIIIVKYRNCMDIDVYFPEYNWIAKNRTYNSFKNGQIKCPFEKTVYGIGYLGSGNYEAHENGKLTKVYDTWKGMLKRCYDPKYHKRNPSYANCNIFQEWHNFQNFGEWDEDNYYEIEGEKMCLDKDILYKGNKIYSPDTCIYVPQTINTLFIKCDRSRGSSPIGTNYYKNGKYVAHCSLINPETGKSKQKTLGYYNTEQEAFEVYKQFKENYIKQVADEYKDKIPSKLYEALYNYQVEITD